jgi:Zn-dependent peptidase ImmA (M78 family)
MRSSEFLAENLNLNKANLILDKFVEFAANEIGLKQLPEINFFTDTARSVKNSSFGGYGGKQINITVVNRHVMDVLRTLAHELVHFKQDIEGRITSDDDGKDGSPIENEANAEAAVVMRKWGKLHPEMFKLPPIV